MDPLGVLGLGCLDPPTGLGIGPGLPLGPASGLPLNPGLLGPLPGGLIIRGAPGLLTLGLRLATPFGVASATGLVTLVAASPSAQSTALILSRGLVSHTRQVQLPVSASLM